ncbi:MAG: hypothetical protein K1X88_08605 [Nannocystaceae bacterium]|nr:hypothetical protein [Nannocystaceae bacterium]
MRPRATALLAGLLAGCGDGGTATGGDGTSAASADSGSSTAAPGTTSLSDSSGAPGSSSGAPMPEMIPARGLHIDWVEANQGVGVPIGLDGAWVGPGDRLARLIKNRVTLIRAFWLLDEGFEPREIEGHLILGFPDGTTERLVDTKMIDDDAFIGNLDRVFYWGIEAERSQPGLTYAVELYEHDPAYADGAPAQAPYFPSEGTPQLIGFEDSYQLIKVTVVPFNYDDGASCVTEPDISDETMQHFQDLMYMMNPIDRLDFTLHDAIDWNTPLENFGQLNAYLSDLRFQEGAPPEMYYYGLVDVCSGGLGGAGGQAFGIPDEPSMDLAYQRVSSGLSLDPDWSAETFVHEVGHTQGRRHVFCNGEEGGPDPSYPHQGGDVGEWGFGVIDFQLRHPTATKDYMTYCHPVWVGTWGWNKVQPFVETLSMWDPDFPGAGAPADPYGGSVLVGTIAPSGLETWITVPGRVPRSLDEEGGDERTSVRYAFADGRVVTHEARVRRLPDSFDRQILAPLPDGFDDVVGIVRDDRGVQRAVPRTQIREGHRARRVVRPAR